MPTVVVACKVPNGIRISSPRHGDALIDGPRPVPAGQPQPMRPGGYVFTENVSAELWAAWVAGHADADVVVRKMIFAADTLDQARGLAYVNGRATPLGHALGAARG